MAKNKTPDLMSKLVALCKRRGIVFQSSEIYGGVGSTFDYGPPGVEMKNNIARLWWQDMTFRHENIVGLDSAVILHPRVWETSGHVKKFHEEFIECRNCKKRFKSEDLFSIAKESFIRYIDAHLHKKPIQPKDMIITGEFLNRYINELDNELSQHPGELSDSFIDNIVNTFVDTIVRNLKHVTCPNCNETGFLTDPRNFQLMFKSNIGVVEDESNLIFFRPETAQGMYVDYRIVQESSRLKVPFGIAQIGKAFRIEITPGNFIFRTREFEQMEMQFFVRPGETSEWLQYWKEQRWNWYLSMGASPDKLRWAQHPQDKLPHYAREAWDVEYEFPFGWSELEGVHDRGEYDLKAHQEASGKDMTYFDDEQKARYIPHIVETSAGLNRTMLMLLCDAYREDVQAGESRVYLALDPKVAPVKAAIFPLVKKDGLAEIARAVADDLRGRWPVFYDAQGSIGRRYRRQDEIGTPYAFTIDYQTKDDGTVTVRWRDTLEQERIGKDRIGDFLIEKFGRL